MSKNTNLSFLTDYITADITNGRIGINNASPTVAFDVTGATKITGVLTLTSTISNGTYAYTLPSATGTLALTSALSGYLPLTGGTLTGALSGTSATFTTGLIVSNVADVYPEFKTSSIDGDAFLGFSNTGDANSAWSIGRRNTGEFWISTYTGNFNSGTRTQPLIIASTGAATFSSSITATGVGLNPSLRLTNTTATTGVDWHLYSLNNGNLGVYNNTSSAYVLQIASTGAATFSSSVTATTLTLNTTTADYAATITNVQDSSQGLLIRATDNDTTKNLLNLQSSNTTTGQTWVDRFTVTKAGNVGIGTTSPSDKLQVGLDENAYISIANGGSTDVKSGLRFRVGGGGTVYSAMESAASSSGNGYLSFSTIGSSTLAERMRITSGGSLLMAKDSAIGINTSDGADNGYLALCGASADGENRGGYIYLSGNERVSDPGMVVIGAGNVIGIGSVIAFRTGAGVERMRLIGNGRLLIGTSTDQGYLLFVNGNAAGTSGFANLSDIRLKKDIIPIKNGLDKINRLNGVSFNWDKTLRPDLNVDDNNHLGLIAQDVEEILPQVIITGDDEFNTKTIIYSDIVPVLIEAIKELSKEINLLKNK